MRPVALVTAAVLLLVTASARAADPATAGKANPPVGINLAGISYWSTEMPFVDVFRASQDFKSQAKGRGYAKGDPLELTADGYPKRLPPDHWADSIVLGVGGDYPGGEYVCLYEGKGKVELGGDARMTEQAPGRILATVTPKHHILVTIRETDPADPVRHIRVMLVAHEATHESEPFRPEFLRRWRGMKVLRFMDWMATNGSKVSAWEDRPKPLDQTWGGQGVPLETMVALANTLDADPWFCMPHLATDDYVRRFASAVKERLEPDRKVYVEYSNETWNFIFAQTRYCLEQGKKLGLSDNDFQAALRYHSRRACEVFRIWEDVFGGRDRLVRVLATQHSNPWVTEQVVSWQDAAKKADAVAGAPYFGYQFGDPKTADAVAALEPEEILKRCEETIAKERETIVKQVALATKCGLKYFAYEFGQHLVGHGGAENNQKLMDLFIGANRHPAMKGLYLAQMGNWKAAGGDLIMIFSSTCRPSKWGSWGVLESESQDPATAPKFQAVREFIAGKPSE